MISKPSGSSNANERDDTDAGSYDVRSRTQEGCCMMGSVAYWGFSVDRAEWHSAGL